MISFAGDLASKINFPMLIDRSGNDMRKALLMMEVMVLRKISCWLSFLMGLLVFWVLEIWGLGLRVWAWPWAKIVVTKY